MTNSEGIVLYIEPYVTMTWDEFKAKHGSYSMAIDGYVVGPSKFDASGPWANFDHHKDVDRLGTRATCAQVLIAIRAGLFDGAFRDKNGARAAVFGNHPDEDICLTWFLLKHHYLVKATMNPILNRLVGMVDMLDTTLGTYSYPIDLPALGELAWIFEPYNLFKKNGSLDRKDPQEFLNVVSAVESRISDHIALKGKSIPIDTHYERIGGGEDWIMIKESGSHARAEIFSRGIYAFVSVRERAGGRFNYVIGRMSQYITTVPLPNILRRLNQEEGGWGGNDDFVIGSDRNRGSEIVPDNLGRIIKEEIAKNKKIRTV